MRSRSMLLAAPLAALLATPAFVGCDGESFSGAGPGDTEDARALDAGDEAAIGEVDASADVVDAAVAFDGAPVPVRCNVPSCVIALSAGAEHYCATMEDRSVRCWGDTNALPLPPDGGAEAEPGKPSLVDGLAPALDIALAGNATCIVDAAGAVWCWTAWDRTPSRVPEIPSATRVFLGPNGQTRCILNPSSELVCWGDSELGQGMRTVDLHGSQVVDVRLGNRAGLAVASDGTLFSWGFGLQLGHSYAGPEPMPVFDLAGVEVIAIGDAHACARTRTGELFCWGQGLVGELGTGLWRSEVAPTRVALSGSIAAHSIASADAHTCLRTTSSDVYCWGGANARGELGLVAKRGVYVPTRVELPEGAVAVDVAVGHRSSCALLGDGRVLCWGDNTLGQLGRGARDVQRHPEPQAVVFP